jgi:hypothetical protein
VDLNAKLEIHLKVMHARRAPNSQWLFPSPQGGKTEEHAKTFRESLLMTRTAPGWICQDCKKARVFGCPPKPTLRSTQTA